MSNSTASEAKVSQLWDHCIENAIVKTGTGLAIGGLVALIALRSPVTRAFATAFGAGIGCGIAYTDCSTSLQQNSKSPAMAAFKLPTFSFPSSSSSSSPAAAAPKAAPAAAAAEKK